MQYLATHYWHSGERDGSSLVLQQAFHKRKRMPVLLACIHKNGQGENAFPQEAVDWFYGKCLELCDRNGENRIEVIEKALSDFLGQVLRKGESDNKSSEMVGLLIVGQSFMMFRKGRQQIRVINTRNHRSYCSELAGYRTEDGEMVLQTGLIQKGVGLLLATDSFNDVISRDMVEECLRVEELHTQEQADKRLRELGNVVNEHNKRDVGAVLIVSY